MVSQDFDKVSELIATAGQVAVVVKDRPGLDDMAAGLALALSLEKSGKRVSVVCPTPPSVALANLVGINKIKQQSAGGSGGKGLIISLPYQQGAIEKISYDIVGDRINLTVLPGAAGLTFTTDDITYQTPSEAANTIFTIGIRAEAELTAIYPDNRDSALINIDWDMQNGRYGTVALVDEMYSSESEIVAKLLMELRLPLEIDIAQNLLSGIVDKTQNFQDEYTSTFAFEIASQLMQKGARRGAVKTMSAATVKDQFFAEEEVKAQQFARPQAKPAPVRNNNVQPFYGAGANQGNQPQRDFRHQPQQPKGNVRQPVQQVKTDNAKAPKDWFEPKIYRGSMPVS